MSVAAVYEVEHLHQPDGWLSPGYLEVGADGRILSVSGTKPAGKPLTRLKGYGVPGLSNLHSHAFQRALAGRTEFVTAAQPEDNLWTWRKDCLLYTSPSPRDRTRSRMPSSA